MIHTVHPSCERAVFHFPDYVLEGLKMGVSIWQACCSEQGGRWQEEEEKTRRRRRGRRRTLI